MLTNNELVKIAAARIFLRESGLDKEAMAPALISALLQAAPAVLGSLPQLGGLLGGLMGGGQQQQAPQQQNFDPMSMMESIMNMNMMNQMMQSMFPQPGTTAAGTVAPAATTSPAASAANKAGFGPNGGPKERYLEAMKNAWRTRAALPWWMQGRMRGPGFNGMAPAPGVARRA